GMALGVAPGREVVGAHRVGETRLLGPARRLQQGARRKLLVRGVETDSGHGGLSFCGSGNRGRTAPSSGSRFPAGARLAASVTYRRTAADTYRRAGEAAAEREERELRPGQSSP